jgi:hypothetical protein
MEKIQDVKKGKMQSAYVDAPFDKGKEALEADGYRLISAQEQAGLRIKEGANSTISRYGNWTKEGFVYVPNKGVFLTKNSPIVANATEATEANRQGNWFYVNDAQTESALADAVKVSKGRVPTNRFADEEVTRYLFGDDAKAYGEFLRENKIDSMPIWLADAQSKPFATQLWFGGLGIVSGLNGVGRGLSFSDSRVRGVRAFAQKNSKGSKGELYTPEQIKVALKKANLSGIEGLLFKSLK